MTRVILGALVYYMASMGHLFLAGIALFLLAVLVAVDVLRFVWLGK